MFLFDKIKGSKKKKPKQNKTPPYVLSLKQEKKEEISKLT